jgi:DMSO/TMAO reductase YedYZ molybdopterin-dependent catalytic subunit
VAPARIPPGQHLTAGFPVLHVGSAPTSDPASWQLKVTGLVEQRLAFDWHAFLTLPRVTSTSDFHCVTGWSRLDNTWTGVRVRDVLRQAGVKPTATHALVYGHPAYSANLDLDVLLDDDVLLATSHDGEPLSAEHGGPVRLVVPQRYGWKSVKWVTDLQLLDRDVRGYWEERGYHDVADPFLEQRYRDA